MPLAATKHHERDTLVTRAGNVPRRLGDHAAAMAVFIREMSANATALPRCSGVHKDFSLQR